MPKDVINSESKIEIQGCERENLRLRCVEILVRYSMTHSITDLLDLDRYPIDQPQCSGYTELVARCQADLSENGMFNLSGFMHPDAAHSAVAQLAPDMATHAFEHKREHNIYFLKDIPGLPDDHPALQKCKTINHTLCADQMPDNPVTQIYEFLPLANFLSDVMQRPKLYLMEDPLARYNVMAYRAGEALNWHFDRSEFTTTLLLQAPEQGGAFVYRSDLRTADDPNYDGVARLLRGQDDQVKFITLDPGTLNVFKGLNTPHRVSPVQGETERVIAVFSYYERPGVMFSQEERLGFYGRAG